MRKKTLNYFMLRSIFAILLGVLLITMESAIQNLVITMGILCIVFGVVSLVGYLIADKEKKQLLVLIGAICASVLGLVLTIFSGFFHEPLARILGVVLLIGAVEQIVTLIRAQKALDIPGWFYASPAVLAVIGIISLFNLFNAGRFAIILIGISCVIYGIMQFVYWINFKRDLSEKQRLAQHRHIEDAQLIEE